MTAGHAHARAAERVFMVTWGIADDFGGMTTMCLQRARMFSEHAGVVTPVLTFEPVPGYGEVIESLHRKGLAFDGLHLCNVYQYYRAADLEPLPGRPTRAVIDPDRPDGCAVSEVLDEDGAVFSRITTVVDPGTVILREYLRPDGTTYLTDESTLGPDGRARGRTLTLVTRDGLVAGRWSGAGNFYRDWIRSLSQGQDTALIIDSIFAARMLTSFEEPNIVKLAVLHNSHTVPGEDPLAGSIAPRQKVLAADSSAWDAVVFLTDRQLSDFVRAFGEPDNVCAISNARERVPTMPPFEGRSRTNGAMVCSLDTRKNVDAAIRIILRAAEKVPDVHLDVYGSGPEEARLRQLVADLGAERHVTLHGSVPQAARAFDTAAFSLLTSRKEGQPLVLMESLGRGCPPVSFDIRYGPDSLVVDGQNGFLVPDEDEEAAAERVVQICTDAALAHRLSAAAWDSSAAFGERAILETWLEAIAGCFSRKGGRQVVDDLAFEVRKTTLLGSGATEIHGVITWGPTSQPDEDGIEPALLVRRRAIRPPDLLPVEVVDRGPGRMTVIIRLSPGDLALEPGGPGKFLDPSLVVTGNNLLRHVRLTFGAGTEPWLPYSTAHGALSLQRRRRGSS